jgi:hypothetical protein
MAGPGCERLKYIYCWKWQFIYSRSKSMLNACLFNSILYCCLKYVDFYIC